MNYFLNYALVCSLILLFSCQSAQKETNTEIVVSAFKPMSKCSELSPARDIKLANDGNSVEQSVDGYYNAGLCYFYSSKLMMAKLFFEKTLNSDNAHKGASLGLARVHELQGDKRLASLKYEKLLKGDTRNLPGWRYYTAFALNHYDLVIAKQGIDKLSRVKKYSNIAGLYQVYLLVLQDKFSQAKEYWVQKVKAQSFENTPDTAFIAAYVGYLIGDKIGGVSFLETSKDRVSNRKYSKLKLMLEKLK